MEWKKRNLLNAHVFCTEFDEKAIKDIFSRSNIQDGRSILETDFHGMIVRFIPKEAMQWMDIWFLQNLCLMQRAEELKVQKSNQLDIQKLQQLEKRVAELESEVLILKRAAR